MSVRMLGWQRASLVATALLLILSTVQCRSEGFWDESTENTPQVTSDESDLSLSYPEVPIEVEHNDEPEKNLHVEYTFSTNDEKIDETANEEENQPNNIQLNESDNGADLQDYAPSDEASFTEKHVENKLNTDVTAYAEKIVIPTDDITDTDISSQEETNKMTEIKTSDENPTFHNASEVVKSSPANEVAVDEKEFTNENSPLTNENNSKAFDLLNDAPFQEDVINDEDIPSDITNESDNFNSDNADTNQNIPVQPNLDSNVTIPEDDAVNLASDDIIIQENKNSDTDSFVNFFDEDNVPNDKVDEIKSKETSEIVSSVNQDSSDKTNDGNDNPILVDVSTVDTDVPAKNEGVNIADATQNDTAQPNLDSLADFFDKDNMPNDKTDNIQLRETTKIAENVDTSLTNPDNYNKIDEDNDKASPVEASAIDTDVPAKDFILNQEDAHDLETDNQDTISVKDGGLISDLIESIQSDPVGASVLEHDYTVSIRDERLISDIIDSLENDPEGAKMLENGQMVDYSTVTNLDILQTVAQETFAAVEDTGTSKTIDTDESADNNVDVLSIIDDADAQPELNSSETSSTDETTLTSDEKKCPSECVCEFKSMDDVSIDCTERALSEIPDALDESVTSLSLGKNNIILIPSNFGQRFSKLKTLVLEENNIQHIELGAFRGPIDLQSINLRDNLLTGVPEEVTSLTNIQNLNLNGNPIDESTPIEAKQFSQLTNLKELNLPNTSPTSLLNELCEEHNTLNTVYIGDNKYRCADLPKETAIVITDDKTSEAIDGINEKQDISITSSDSGPSLFSDIRKQNDQIDGLVKSFLETAPERIDKKFGEAEDFIQKKLDQASKMSDGAIDKVLQETAKAIKAVKEQTSDKLISAIDNTSDTTTAAQENSEKVLEEINKVTEAINSDIGVNNIPKAVLNSLNLPSNTPQEASKTQTDIEASNITDESGQLSPPVETIGELSEKKSGDLKDADKNPEKGGETAAAKANAGGGVDNVVIGLVVAGMLMTVAGVAIKKNWSKIKKTFKSSPRPPEGSANGHGPHAPEEAEPLRDDKSPA